MSLCISFVRIGNDPCYLEEDFVVLCWLWKQRVSLYLQCLVADASVSLTANFVDDTA